MAQVGAPRALARAVRRRLWLAKLVLTWERLWPALWPAAGVAGLFLVATLFDLWRLVPGWLHMLSLVLFGTGIVVALVHGLRCVSLPDEAAAIRRLERASGLDHRPLSLLYDRPVTAVGDLLSLGLWRVHRARMAERAGWLRVGMASPRLARHDPLAFRAALLLVLVIAFAAAAGDFGKRLASAFQPNFAGADRGPAELTLWLTPPVYTGMAPLFLAAGEVQQAALQPTEVLVPSGSTVLARVHGGYGEPTLEVDDEVIAFHTVDAANFELSTTLTNGKRLVVAQNGDPLAAWPLSVIADQPPLIEFASPPGRSQRAALMLNYLAEDDYGLTTVVATITLVGDPTQSLTLGLSLPRGDATLAEEVSFHDLTPHPWAGVEVTIGLTATDALGQQGASEVVATKLPERIFNHPVARRLVEERRKLVLDPSSRGEVGLALDDIASRPDHFFDELNVFLGLRAARWRLFYDRSDEVIESVQNLMWDLALTIEDGPLALAEQILREAEQALLDALARNASDAEIDKLVDELLEALDQFLDAMIEQAIARRDEAPTLADELLQSIERDQIHDLIEQVRELSKTGSREAARELLAQLQMALENMRASALMGENQDQAGEGQEILRDLEGLMDAQQKLLDETFRLSQGSGGDVDPNSFQQGAAKQGKIRDKLGALMRRWGETGQQIPLPFNRADRSMREAQKALQAALAGQAISPQTQSIEQMRDGAQSILETLMEQSGRAPPRPGGMVGGLGDNLDPLGRGTMGRGYKDDGQTRLPDTAEIQRSRDILEELYRRAGEYHRPELEREYIRRLLKRF
ncbi:MAG: TIGR02302 family protein [Alphaproteobacteria bacterium]